MTSRETALAAALKASAGGTPLQDALSDLLVDSGLSPRDRALAEQIALGSLRRRITLDVALNAVLSKPIQAVQGPLAEALRQAAFQVLMLDRIPTHAAVNETVSLVKSQMGKGPAGLANAVLRALGGMVKRKGAPPPTGNETRSCVASVGGRFTQLSRKLLPAPERDLVGWLAPAYGYPHWIASRWLERYGRERCEAMLLWGNTPPATCARLNSTRTSGWPLGEDEAARVFDGCSEYSPLEMPGTYRVSAPMQPGELPGFAAGKFTIQDPTQVRPARVLAPRPGATVLDMCAGLGGKTLQLAEMVGEGGRVVSLEKDAAKSERARASAKRLGLDNVVFLCGDCLEPPPEARREFEFVMLDAPCSNLGSLDRRPEIRHRADKKTVRRLAKGELELLRSAMSRLAAGGTLVYSVCTLEPEETTDVAAQALDGRDDFALEDEFHVLPIAGARDGGYCARLTRSP